MFELFNVERFKYIKVLELYEVIKMKGSEIRKALEKEFGGKFRVRVKTVGYSKAVDIKTSLLNGYKEIVKDFENLEYKLRVEGVLKGEDSERYWILKEKIEEFEKIEKKIIEFVYKMGWYKVDICPVSLEVLEGGNIYVNIYPLN